MLSYKWYTVIPHKFYTELYFYSYTTIAQYHQNIIPWILPYPSYHYTIMPLRSSMSSLNFVTNIFLYLNLPQNQIHPGLIKSDGVP
jgi:hypothetical protein